MPYNKKKILTVFYWFISVIVEAFIAITIMNAIYMYVFIYKNMAGYYNKAFFFPLKFLAL